MVNPAGGRLLAPFTPVAVLAFGLALAAAGMLLLTEVQTSTSLGGVAWRLSVLGVADAFPLSAVALAAIDTVPQHLAGMAAAANTALRQCGAALGPAVLGVIFANAISGGATTAPALHTALTLNCALLLIASTACVLTAGLAPKQHSVGSPAS